MLAMHTIIRDENPLEIGPISLYTLIMHPDAGVIKGYVILNTACYQACPAVNAAGNINHESIMIFLRHRLLLILPS
jgi:hypothetical protein